MKATEKEFLTLIEAHKRMLHKVSRMFVEDIDEQKDLFQEIVLQLWRSFDSFKSNSQFSTWMYRVAVNASITYIRKETKRPDRQRLHQSVDVADSEPQTEQELQLSHFYQAVHELNPIEKSLIFLFLEGLSHKQIGENIGISEVNARVKLNRTKDKLQQIIKKNGYEF